MGEKRNAMLGELHGFVERVLLTHEVPAGTASNAASALIDHLADYWGGAVISFPKDYRWKLSQKELAIYDGFTGSNYGQLALQHDMTERGVRLLIARVGAKLASFRHEQQLDMLDPPAEI